jgi:hypothetical protein
MMTIFKISGALLKRLRLRAEPPFKLRGVSFKGNGLQRDAKGASWAKLRDIYEDRGA